MTDELRRKLDRLAAEAPTPGERRDEVLSKARRRSRIGIAVASGAAVATVLVGALAIGAVLDRTTTTSPIGPSPTGTVDASESVAPTAAPRPAGRIAFLRRGDVVTVDVDGEETGPLGTIPAVRAGEISLSPDGSRLVFDRTISESAGSIETMDTSDGSVTPLLTLEHIPRSPDWSPTGDRIAFVTDSSALFTMAADGSDRRWVGGDLEGEDPSWSPDGTQLAYITPGGDVAVVGARGDRGPRVIASVGEASSPDWGPGIADPIVFQATIGQESFLFIVNPDGTGLRPLLEQPGNYGQPSLSPDGGFIAFTDDAGGQPDIFVVPLGGGRVTRVTDDAAQEISPVWHPQS